MDLGRHMDAVRAFLSLGMAEDALEELARAEALGVTDPELYELKAAVLMQRKDWGGALRILDALCRALPFAGDHFLHAAFCLHELKRTAEARDKLLSGPATLRKRALFHYNLACYEARLGGLETARALLDRAVRMDPKLREVAREDPDLEALRGR